MKILFLSSWYPNRLNPHLGNFIQRHAEAVSGFNEVASLFVCSDPNLSDKKVEVEIKNVKGIYSVNVYYRKVPFIPLIGLLVKFLRFQKANRIGYNEVIKHFNGNPDVVHLNVAFPAGLFATQLKKQHHLPYILTEHSTKYHLKMKWVESYFTKKICNEADLICPVSDDLRKAMQKKGFGKNFEVVPNVVDTNLFKVSAYKAGGKKKIIHISTLVEWQKNISGILRVIKKISGTRNDFEMHVISEKDSTDAVAQARQLELLDTVVYFHTDQQIEKVAEMIRDSDLLLLFSNVENQPCVIVESLASGVPVVSSNVGGIPEMINEKNGMLVNAKDEDSLYLKLNVMLDRYQSFNREYIRKSAITNYSYEIVGKKFTDIYRRILIEN